MRTAGGLKSRPVSTDRLAHVMTDAASVPGLVRGLCVFGAVVCAAIAGAAVANVQETAATLGFAFAGSHGQVEFLTMYGGFYAGLAVVFLIGVGSRAVATGAMAVLVFSNLGALVGRVAAMVTLDTVSDLLIGLAIGEVVLAALGAWGWHRISRA